MRLFEMEVFSCEDKTREVFYVVAKNAKEAIDMVWHEWPYKVSEWKFKVVAEDGQLEYYPLLISK